MVRSSAPSSAASRLWAIVEAGNNTGNGQAAKLTRQALFASASNGYDSHSPGHFALGAVIITESLFTALFILVIAGTTRSSAIAGFAGIRSASCWCLMHLVTIPIDNTSVNPARSFATAIFGAELGLEQLWVFIVFPIIGGLIGAVIWRFITTPEEG